MSISWCLWLFFGFVRLVQCEEINVEVSFSVLADYNESMFFDRIFNPSNASRDDINTSNITGNASLSSNTSNHTSPSRALVVPFVKNSIFHMLSVVPIICIVGYKCFNDTTVTRIDTPAPAHDQPLPVGIILGTCATFVVLVVVLGIWTRGGFRKKQVPAERRPVTPITIDWPPRDLNKKLSQGNGMLRPHPSAVLSSQPIQFVQYIHPAHPTHPPFNHA